MVREMETALIVGAGSGLSASLARLLEKEGFRVALAARNPEKLAALRALALRCDATDAAQVEDSLRGGRGANGACPTSSSTTRATARAARSSS